MARSGLTDSARVPIGLKVSEADAARIDEVLARPEFAGWTRVEWCREIIRTALRYYVGEGAAAGPPGRSPASPAAGSAAPAAPEPGPVVPSDAGQPAAPTPAAPASEPEPTVPEPTVPEPTARPDCRHPPDARDYDTGTCAVCGAILWD